MKLADIGLGCFLALAATLCVYIAYEMGAVNGKNDVISTCSYYKKYALDGTQYLLCSGVVKQEDMMPSVAETNAKYYSKENKDAHKKDRK